jgi:hypothetical protein
MPATTTRATIRDTRGVRYAPVRSEGEPTSFTADRLRGTAKNAQMSEVQNETNQGAKCGRKSACRW